jgi:hypothetical protein
VDIRLYKTVRAFVKLLVDVVENSFFHLFFTKDCYNKAVETD